VRDTSAATSSQQHIAGLSSITARKSLVIQKLGAISKLALNDHCPTRRFIMNDKVTPMASVPTLSKDVPVEAKIAQSGKDEQSRLKAEPGPAPAVKS
jgi:hypothetical protein